MHVPLLPVVKFPDFCYGVQASFEEHLVIVHVVSRMRGKDQSQGQTCHYFCYFSNEADMDQFRIVISQALHTIQRKRRYLVIVNRESGQGRAGTVYAETVAPMLQAAACTHFVKESEYNRHISLFAAQFDPATVDGVILIGGDGTVNEFLNGLFSRRDWPAIQATLPVTLVPCGVKLQLAARFGVNDATLAVFSALRDRTFQLHPIVFVQTRRRFYGHSYLQISPRKRTYIKLYYLNGTTATATATPDADSDCETVASSVDSIVSKGPALRFYHKFAKLDVLDRAVSSATIAVGPASDLQLCNTFDPSQTHPLALMSNSTKTGAFQRLWHSLSCRSVTTSDELPPKSPYETTELWPRMLAMTKAGFLQIEDTGQFPPSLNKDRWFVDGELIGTESVYFESLDTPILLTLPPVFLLD